MLSPLRKFESGAAAAQIFLNGPSQCQPRWRHLCGIAHVVTLLVLFLETRLQSSVLPCRRCRDSNKNLPSFHVCPLSLSIWLHLVTSFDFLNSGQASIAGPTSCFCCRHLVHTLKVQHSGIVSGLVESAWVEL